MSIVPTRMDDTEVCEFRMTHATGGCLCPPVREGVIRSRGLVRERARECRRRQLPGAGARGAGAGIRW